MAPDHTPPPSAIEASQRRGRRFVGRGAYWISAAAGTTLIALLLCAGTGYVYEPFPQASPTRAVEAPAAVAAPGNQASRSEARVRQLRARLKRLGPRGLYVVIDQTHNRLSLRRDDKTVFESVCSAGSGMVLKEDATGRTWVFDTPRGRFQVLSKLENPVWRKPDWAFIEEGQPIPANVAERFEYGTLGEYALYFGNGFMIHGTLYERLLGRSVTHGCIRLGRDDLRKVFAMVPIGTPIYIY